MNTEEHLQQLLQEAKITTSAAVDENILAGARQSLKLQSRGAKTRLLSVSLRIAAGVLILLGVVTWWIPKSGSDPDIEPVAGENPAAPLQTLSIRSLRQACLGGDIDALEDHLDRTLSLVGPRPTALLDEVLSQSSTQS